jgi:hypothetical protein
MVIVTTPEQAETCDGFTYDLPAIVVGHQWKRYFASI